MKRKIAFLLIFLASAPFIAYGDKPPKSAANAPTTGRGLCEENFDLYREKLHKDPDDAKAWQELRVCADLLKRWGEAGAIATSAIDHGVKRPEPHIILGMAHYKTKD